MTGRTRFRNLERLLLSFRLAHRDGVDAAVLAGALFLRGGSAYLPAANYVEAAGGFSTIDVELLDCAGAVLRELLRVTLTRCCESNHASIQVRAFRQHLEVLLQRLATFVGQRAGVASEEYRVHFGDLRADSRLARLSADGERARGLGGSIRRAEGYRVGTCFAVRMRRVGAGAGRADRQSVV